MYIVFFYSKRLHPQVVDLQGRRDLLIAASKKLSQALGSEISETLRCFGLHFNEESAALRSAEIEKNTVNLSSPIQVIDAVKRAKLDIKDLRGC